MTDLIYHFSPLMNTSTDMRKDGGKNSYHLHTLFLCFFLTLLTFCKVHSNLSYDMVQKCLLTESEKANFLAYIVNALIRVIDSEKEEKRLSLRDLLTIDFANGGVAD